MVEYRLVAYKGNELIHRSELIPTDQVENYKKYLYSIGSTVIEIWLIRGIIK
jgi:hypothetical protein